MRTTNTNSTVQLSLFPSQGTSVKDTQNGCNLTATVNNYLKTRRGLKVLILFGWGESLVEAIKEAPTFKLGAGGRFFSLGENLGEFDTLLDWYSQFDALDSYYSSDDYNYGSQAPDPEPQAPMQAYPSVSSYLKTPEALWRMLANYPKDMPVQDAIRRARIDFTKCSARALPACYQRDARKEVAA